MSPISISKIYCKSFDFRFTSPQENVNQIAIRVFRIKVTFFFNQIKIMLVFESFRCSDDFFFSFADGNYMGHVKLTNKTYFFFWTYKTNEDPIIRINSATTFNFKANAYDIISFFQSLFQIKCLLIEFQGIQIDSYFLWMNTRNKKRKNTEYFVWDLYKEVTVTFFKNLYLRLLANFCKWKINYVFYISVKAKGEASSAKKKEKKKSRRKILGEIKI